jgi:hypothetical protein
VFFHAFFCSSRNNSARELSAFAESAMAVNRVVLQHMSLNMLEENPDADGGDASPNVVQV